MTSNSNPVTDSEEESKRELEKIKNDIIAYIGNKDEP